MCLLIYYLFECRVELISCICIGWRFLFILFCFISFIFFSSSVHMHDSNEWIFCDGGSKKWESLNIDVLLIERALNLPMSFYLPYKVLSFFIWSYAFIFPLIGRGGGGGGRSANNHSDNASQIVCSVCFFIILIGHADIFLHDSNA